jgi:Putative Flp pilus-assembly TadE/G-like
VTLALVALIGFVGLALDAGYAWAARRRMQTAADTAATAGAVASRLGYTVTPAAKDAASLNGFSDGTNGVTVNVTSPYSGGSCSSNCVKVAIDQAQSTYFLRVLGYSSIDVKASAVAGTVNSGNCVYALRPSAPPGLEVQGSPTVSISCGATVNSTQSPAAQCGGEASFTASSIGVAEIACLVAALARLQKQAPARRPTHSPIWVHNRHVPVARHSRRTLVVPAPTVAASVFMVTVT